MESCLGKENLGRSCIELRIPHTKRTDADGQTLIVEGGEGAKNADEDPREFGWTKDAKFSPL